MKMTKIYLTVNNSHPSLIHGSISSLQKEKCALHFMNKTLTLTSQLFFIYLVLNVAFKLKSKLL
jgi:hypothetical protein